MSINFLSPCRKGFTSLPAFRLCSGPGTLACGQIPTRGLVFLQVRASVCQHSLRVQCHLPGASTLLMPRLLNYLMIDLRLTARVAGIWCNLPVPVKPASLLTGARISQWSTSPFIGGRIISRVWFVICWSGRTVFYGNVRIRAGGTGWVQPQQHDSWQLHWRMNTFEVEVSSLTVNSQLLHTYTQQTIIFLRKKG